MDEGRVWWHDGTGIWSFVVENPNKIREICFFPLYFSANGKTEKEARRENSSKYSQIFVPVHTNFQL